MASPFAETAQTQVLLFCLFHCFAFFSFLRTVCLFSAYGIDRAWPDSCFSCICAQCLSALCRVASPTAASVQAYSITSSHHCMSVLCIWHRLLLKLHRHRSSFFLSLSVSPCFHSCALCVCSLSMASCFACLCVALFSLHSCAVSVCSLYSGIAFCCSCADIFCLIISSLCACSLYMASPLTETVQTQVVCVSCLWVALFPLHSCALCVSAHGIGFN